VSDEIPPPEDERAERPPRDEDAPHPAINEPADHATIDELADLDEGLLPPDRISKIRAHLGACESCRTSAEALRTTSRMLGSLGEVRLPEDVAARIEGALAAEATGSAAVDPDPPDPPLLVTEPAGGQADVVPDLTQVPRRRWGRPSMAASAAAAVVLLAIIAIAIGHANHHHDNLNQAAGLPGSAGASGAQNLYAQSQNVNQLATGRTYTPASLHSLLPGLVSGASIQQGLPAAPSVTPPGTSSTNPSSTPSGTSGTAGAPTHPGSKQTLNTTTGGTGTGGTSTTLAPLGAAAPVPKSLQHLQHSYQALLNCAATTSGQPGAVPAAVDFGRWTDPTHKPPFHKAPSVIFVFQDTGKASTYDVYVVDPACDGTFEDFLRITLPG
jgi:hypothetical protein